MKHFYLTPKTLPVLAITCLFWACTKSPVVTPSNTTNAASADQSVNDSSLRLSPGIYKITRFSDEGKNETTDFTGYRFNFQADRTLIVRTNSGDHVTGTWRRFDKGIMMEIDISGKDELDKISDTWIVVNITDMEISLRNQQPDHVVFTKIN